MLSPVDGVDPYGFVQEYCITPGEKLNFEVPTLIMTSGLDGIPGNASHETLKWQKADFFHFGGNSLRRVHVFLRHPEKTYHPFFGPEMGVLTLFSKKRPKRPKKFFKQREGKFFFTSVYLAK